MHRLCCREKREEREEKRTESQVFLEGDQTHNLGLTERGHGYKRSFFLVFFIAKHKLTLKGISSGARTA